MKIKANHQTAVLIFAAAGGKDSARKGFAGKSLLFDTLTQRTVQTVEQSGLPYYIFSDQEQKGSSFGERLSHAISATYQLGYKNVIAIGNDTPQLDTGHLMMAASNCINGITTIGPSSDGGFYLLGISKAQFSSFDIYKKNSHLSSQDNISFLGKGGFAQLPWQSGDLLKCLLEGIKNKVVYLDTLMDIDSIDDVHALLSQEHLDNITMQLLLLLWRIDTALPQLESQLYSNHYSSIYFNKGSPC